ncbi:hypothetical protein NL108_013506 [Boleophthalmus pectinirostris]|uniref:Piscidin 1 n=1 Tax=Boleophthalmus pectinirostris TaxID=150288 RepID=A0A3Q8BH10_BOLPE|nr:piscidin 1 [Boleophthalmus pectinirostris]KAJ0061205.1 hypothetical protein NL108_013506 [Boleophthalmus pectinirostris]
MKLTLMFLVFGMVVMMAEPGEGFFHKIIQGVGRCVHGVFQGKDRADDQDLQMYMDKQQDYPDAPNTSK